ncbi:NRDE family protein [Muricauda sp. CAU 1633]|uniref:NRDE family protein n=1 Tax=Allomuricauda sp. CAU 1633 TaxID=2816036 RepID=UPI001A8F613C|nr:NRDE family protein [Muricauda sp. CAU 1633]MBO0322669.1 NRDE family protein [Muricauda sp. CAU 1633]
MCTVSFISRNNRYYITSNRDEHVSRPLAYQPQEKTINDVKVLFPKDPKAGGTWFAINELGVVSVLLNGAYVRHQSKGSYVKSRGLVLLDVISSLHPETTLQQMDLYNIEPFTLILLNGSLLEFRWDGNQKYFTPLDKAKDHIWSSVTLYTDDVIAKRASLFDSFLRKKEHIEAKDVVDFHSNNHKDFENGFIIDRETGLKTFSVTQTVLDQEEILMRHIDLLSDTTYEVPFFLNDSLSVSVK